MEMKSEMEYVLILSTCPDGESAKKIAKELVERKRAACVQIFPIESIYTWQGQVCEEPERMLLIKSKARWFDSIAELIQELHPYEVPEIIQIPISQGLPAYLRWMDELL